MNRRRQRRAVAHRAVAVELAADLHGRKHERHGGARHQMVDRERRGAADAANPRPRRELGPPLKERYRPRSRVRRSRHRHGVEMPLLDRTANAVEAHVVREQLAQRRVIEQRRRIAHAEAAEHDRGEPVQARLQHRPVIGAIDLARLEVAPDLLHVLDCALEMRGAPREHGRVDRAGRRAADDAERIGCTLRQDAGDRFQNADLIRTAGPCPR